MRDAAPHPAAVATLPRRLTASSAIYPLCHRPSTRHCPSPRPGECDVIVAELARRLGWQGSLNAPGAPAADGRMETTEAAFEFVAPNRYLFKGAILPSAPETVVAAGAPAGCEDDAAGTRAAAPSASAEAAGSGPAEVGAAASAGASGLPPCGADAAAPLRTSADR